MTTPSYDATPPISAPLRFFLTAPVFGLLLGVLLLGIDPDALLSRWSWPVLAGTHLLTLGMLAPVMVGALLASTGATKRGPASRLPSPVMSPHVGDSLST